MNFYKQNRITKLLDNQILVFGSNPEGRHGAGVAKLATKFGAVYGQGRGLMGQTYGLVTKNLTAFTQEPSTGIIYEEEGYRSVSRFQIEDNIRELYKVARNNPDKEFLIPYSHPSKNLNGYTCREMVTMFSYTNRPPSNVLFHESLRDFNKPKPRPDKLRLIVAGGRDFDNFEYGFKVIDHVTQGYDKKDVIIICGRAAGGDACGEQWKIKNRMHGVKIEYFDPAWDDISVPDAVIKYNKFGKPYNAKAGMDRNHEMGDTASALVAFWDKKSKGTKDMIDYMDQLNKPHKIFTY